MDDYKDYSAESYDNSHYCMPSMHGKMVKEQYDMQPKYAEPGDADGEMKADYRNVQVGP